MGPGENRPTSFSLSIVVPMYDEEAMCFRFFERVVPVLDAITKRYEIICVNDGSRDNTLQRLCAARALNPSIKILDLTRNFGKEVALTAGIDSATGDAVIPIDADLQDPPEVIPQLVAKWIEGFDMVLAVRVDRRSDALHKRLSARAFYRVIGWLSDIEIPADAGDFRLMDRKVVDALKLLPERTRFMKGLFAWVGFSQAQVNYSRAEREAGATKWRYWRLWNFALEGLLSSTTLPLRVWTYFGFMIAALALAYAATIVVRTLAFGIDIPGYASLIVVVLFFSGMNMIGLGILGEYLGRVFVEVKQRPLYLTRGRIGFDQPLVVERPARPTFLVAEHDRK